MSDNTLTVRDHTQPCEHGWKAVREEGHQSADGPYYCLVNWCPGGREIVLRHHSDLRRSTKDESAPFELVPVWIVEEMVKPKITDEMIERAAEELRKITVGYIKVGHKAIVERVLRAALEVEQ